MSLIAATAIALKENLPYFLVEEDEHGYAGGITGE